MVLLHYWYRRSRHPEVYLLALVFEVEFASVVALAILCCDHLVLILHVAVFLIKRVIVEAAALVTHLFPVFEGAQPSIIILCNLGVVLPLDNGVIAQLGKG